MLGRSYRVYLICVFLRIYAFHAVSISLDKPEKNNLHSSGSVASCEFRAKNSTEINCPPQICARIFYCPTWDTGVAHKVIMFALPLITNKKVRLKNAFTAICIRSGLIFFPTLRLSVPLVTMVSDLQHHPSWAKERKKAAKQKTQRSK